MGFFDWLSKKNNLPRIAASLSQIVGLQAVKWLGRNSKVYADEGYSRNVIVYRCVSIIAEGVASLPLQVQIGEEVLDKHPLLDLLHKPNQLQSSSQFIEQLVALRLISGKSFLEKIIVGGSPRELWVWPDHHMSVKTLDGHWLPTAFVYENGSVRRTWEVDPITGESDLYNWNSFNPFDMNDGLSAISAAAYATDQHNEAGKWNMRMLQNSAQPSGVLSTEQTLTDGQFKKLKAELAETYAGADNARRAMLLEGGLKWQQVSLSPLDMDWLGGKNSTAQDIAAAFGVPLQVIPLPGSQTFANYEEARLSLWEDTILPLAGTMLDMLNQFVAPAFGDRVRLVYDTDSIPALESRRAAKWSTVSAATFLTIDEKREAVGYPKYVGTNNPAENIWLPAGLLPLSFDGMTTDTDSEETDTTDDENITDEDVEDTEGDQ